MSKPYRVVLDTNVVFEGITNGQSECRLLIDAWLDGLIDVFVTDPIVYEYEEVLARQLSPERWERIEPVLSRLVQLSTFARIYYSWRPSSPDPDDEAMIDCAMATRAIVITRNMRDFRFAQQNYGLPVLTPEAFIELLLS